MEYYSCYYIWYGELYHHGILGQKWGKRNGPPYPLSESKHSSVEKKAGWRKSLRKEPEKDSEAKRAARIEKGKKIVKGIMISAGAIAVTTAVVSVAMSSGSSPDKWLDISKKHSNLKPKFYELTKEQKRRQDYRRVESDVMLWASDKENVPEMVRWLKNKYIYLVRNNYDGSFTAMSRKKAPGIYNGLSERDFNDKINN